MSRYEFRGPDIEIRITDPAIEGGIGIRIEHASGAALLVRSVIPKETSEGLVASITGFDGILYEVTIDREWQSVELRSNSDSPILGGEKMLRGQRCEAAEQQLGPTRITGDETTAPIPVDEE